MSDQVGRDMRERSFVLFWSWKETTYLMKGYFLIWVRIEIELFAGWIPIEEVKVAGIGVSLFLRKRAKERSAIHQCKQSLRNLYSLSFHANIGPGGFSDFVISRIF
jgi:hypothetical protein